MKKELAIISVLILFLLPLATAVDFEINDQYKKSQTLMTKISGTFLEALTTGHIHFYKRHIEVQPREGLIKFDDEYYVFAILPKIPDNYSMTIEEIAYYGEGAEVTDEKITREFIIIDQFAEFSVYPGFISTNEDFFIDVQNLKATKIEVVPETASEKIFAPEIIELNAAQEKRLTFQLADKINESSLEYVHISGSEQSYEIPVYVIGNASNQDDDEDEIKFDFSEAEVIEEFATAPEGEEKINSVKLHIKNTGDVDLEDIEIVISNELLDFVSTSWENNIISELDAGSEVQFDIYVFAPVDAQTVIGHLRAKLEYQSEEINKYLSVELEFDPDVVEPGENTVEPSPEIPRPDPTRPITPARCEDNDDCASDEECVGEICLKSDEPDNGGGTSTGQIIGWTIVAVVVLGGIWFYLKKYRGASRKPDLLKAASRGKSLSIKPTRIK